MSAFIAFLFVAWALFVVVKGSHKIRKEAPAEKKVPAGVIEVELLLKFATS
jgi:large-conductance mechanosensitive channel